MGEFDERKEVTGSAEVTGGQEEEGVMSAGVTGREGVTGRVGRRGSDVCGEPLRNKPLDRFRASTDVKEKLLLSSIL